MRLSAKLGLPLTTQEEAAEEERQDIHKAQEVVEPIQPNQRVRDEKASVPPAPHVPGVLARLDLLNLQQIEKADPPH
jgi:hypothetical protein